VNSIYSTPIPARLKTIRQPFFGYIYSKTNLQPKPTFHWKKTHGRVHENTKAPLFDASYHALAGKRQYLTERALSGAIPLGRPLLKTVKKACSLAELLYIFPFANHFAKWFGPNTWTILLLSANVKQNLALLRFRSQYLPSYAHPAPKLRASGGALGSGAGRACLSHHE